MKVFHERLTSELDWVEWFYRGFDARPTVKNKITDKQSDAIKELVKEIKSLNKTYKWGADDSQKHKNT